MMKKTPFYQKHLAYNAKLIDFAGYELPVQYEAGIVQEHLAVRQSVGVFDVSHMGEFEVKGKDAFKFLQRMTINDVSKLTVGRVQYTAMCFEDGGIVDDLLLYCDDDRYMMVVNASNREKDLLWLQDHISSDVSIDDISDETALLAIQGKRSKEILQSIFGDQIGYLGYYTFTHAVYGGTPMIVSRTGYTGELGYEVYFKSNDEVADRLWDAIFERGQEFEILPVGLGARDTLRLEMGFCLYGNDIDASTNPLEAGLGWITKLQKGDFIGRNVLLSEKKRGVPRKLVGFLLDGKNVARPTYSISANGEQIGKVTSGTFSPSLKQGIGMGYVPSEFANESRKIGIDIRGRNIDATIVKLPFIKKD